MFLLQPFLLMGVPEARLSSVELSVPSHHLSNAFPERGGGVDAHFRGLREGWSWRVSGQSLRLRSWFTPLPWLASGCELREGRWLKVVWGPGLPSDLGQLSSTCQLSYGKVVQ